MILTFYEKKDTYKKQSYPIKMEGVGGYPSGDISFIFLVKAILFLL